MIHVNLFDNNFAHTQTFGCLTSTSIIPPSKLVWIPRKMEFDGITVFTDGMIFDPVVDQVKSKLKIAWLMEPPSINPWAYNNILHIESKFDYILTFDENLLRRGEKYLKYIVGQSRVTNENAKSAGRHPKTKNISLISSGKQMSEGHRFRADVVNALHPKYNFDLWGYAYKPFQEKTEPLEDYEFSICIMNSKINNYFTEILLDCIRLGTIPIFWGCPNIDKYFDVRGMEIFETIEQLDNILSNLKPYSKYSPYAGVNFQLSHEFIHTDDYIAEILKTL